jgi:hypothetical protein
MITITNAITIAIDIVIAIDMNRTRRISEAKTAAKAEWEADKCS